MHDPPRRTASVGPGPGNVARRNHAPRPMNGSGPAGPWADHVPNAAMGHVTGVPRANDPLPGGVGPVPKAVIGRSAAAKGRSAGGRERRPKAGHPPTRHEPNAAQKVLGHAAALLPNGQANDQRAPSAGAKRHRSATWTTAPNPHASRAARAPGSRIAHSVTQAHENPRPAANGGRTRKDAEPVANRPSMASCG